MMRLLVAVSVTVHVHGLSSPAQRWPNGEAPKCGPKVSRPITPTKTAAFESAIASGAAVPSVLLCRPLDDGNVGACARAMLNFGLWDLRLVDPTASASSDEALLRASGAAPILRRSSSMTGLQAGRRRPTAGACDDGWTRESRIPVYEPREAVALATDAIRRGEKVGFLFG